MEFKKNIDARASENIWFFAKIIMKSIFYEWIEFKYELPSLSPQTDYDYLNFSRQKTNETIPRKWRYKKNYEINNKSILTILQTRIYQTNELKYIQNDQKKCWFYLFDIDRELIGACLRIYLFQLQNQNEKTPFKINYFEQW